MTKRTKRTISRAKLNKLAKALGGRGAIAEAIGMSRPAVDRYFIGKGMQQETHERLTALIAEHVDRPRAEPEPELLPEPPTLAEQGGHLYALLVKALERNSGVEAMQSQLNRIERRLDRMEAMMSEHLRAWAINPGEVVDRMLASREGSPF